MTRARSQRDLLDLYRQVLDHELVDSEDLPCGTVDDLEVEGGAGEALRVTAMLVGPGAWGPRLPALFALLARWCFGTRCSRVPWHEVAEVGEKIRLRSRAAQLGLGITDRKLGLRLARIPRSDKSAQ
jgi:hypothetical protein